MTQRASDSLVAVLIRIGLLLALAVLLMAENAQAKPLTTPSWSSQIRTHRRYANKPEKVIGRRVCEQGDSQ